MEVKTKYQLTITKKIKGRKCGVFQLHFDDDGFYDSVLASIECHLTPYIRYTLYKFDPIDETDTGKETIIHHEIREEDILEEKIEPLKSQMEKE